MKKLSLIICISLLIQSVNGQIIDTARTKTMQSLHDSYIKKYKTNITGGRVLLGAGLGMIAIGGIVFASYAGQGYNGPAPVTEEVFLLFVGPGTALASIPFFISAKRNKTKAALSLKGAAVTIGNKASYNCNYTALALTIQL